MSAILSEKKYAVPFIRTAKTSAIAIPRSPPNANPRKSSSNVRAVSRNAVFSVFICDTPRARFLRSARLRRLRCEFHFVASRIGINNHRVTRFHLAVEKLEGQRILNQPLNCALHRTCSVGRIESFAEQKSLSRRLELQRDFSFAQQLHHIAHLQLDDVLDLILAEWLEHHDIVDAVQKFRTEELAKRRHGLLARLLRIFRREFENRS